MAVDAAMSEHLSHFQRAAKDGHIRYTAECAAAFGGQSTIICSLGITTVDASLYDLQLTVDIACSEMILRLPRESVTECKSGGTHPAVLPEAPRRSPCAS